MPERKGKEMVSFKLRFTLELELSRGSSRPGGQSQHGEGAVERITTITNILSSILVLQSIKVRMNRGVVWNKGVTGNFGKEKQFSM